jgi:hypothetical protein
MDSRILNTGIQLLVKQWTLFQSCNLSAGTQVILFTLIATLTRDEYFIKRSLLATVCSFFSREQKLNSTSNTKESSWAFSKLLLLQLPHFLRPIFCELNKAYVNALLNKID